jgi:glycosyltransferase involved in cell wall biosynthesis
VEAFNILGKKLVIIGEGSELQSLKDKALPNIRFLGSQPFSVLKHHYETCRAFVFPGVEDFGITPLEAQAAGAPVLALREGGALETVVDGRTGLFFDEQTPQALIDCVQRFEAIDNIFSPEACRKNATRFGPERFRNEIKTFLTQSFPGIFAGHVWPV